MIKIISDSSCDILTLNKIPFAIVPLTISTKEKDYVDNADLDVHQMLLDLSSYHDRSSTACPSTESWINAFDGADEIYVVTLTSALSGTYNSACLARDIYLEDHPEAKIFVLDSLSTGSQMVLLLEKLEELICEGKTFEEICEKIKEYHSHTHLFFAFKSLHNLAANGRINKVIASAISTLKISIFGTASPEGTISPMGKCRGDKKVLSMMANESLQAGYRGGKIRICHVENPELAQKLTETMRTLYPDADISSHCARGLVSYYGEMGGICMSFEC